jgi:hypothetical protein
MPNAERDVWHVLLANGRLARIAQGGDSGGGHDRENFLGFTLEGHNRSDGEYFPIANQFEPIDAFISFFLNDAEIRDEFRLGSAAASGAVVGAHRGAGASNLIRDDLP